MVAIVKRMRHLQTLLAVRTGPGAAILPPEITRLHLEFAIKNTDGHMGPRRFWQKCLPRLKYHNPGTEMTVVRREGISGPATLTVHYTTPEHAREKNEISSTTSGPSGLNTKPVAGTTSGPPTAKVETIDMQYRTDSEILKLLMDLTKARELEPSEEDVTLINELEQQRQQGERDRAMMKAVNDEKRKQAAMLARARGEGTEAMTAS